MSVATEVINAGLEALRFRSARPVVPQPTPTIEKPSIQEKAPDPGVAIIFDTMGYQSGADNRTQAQIDQTMIKMRAFHFAEERGLLIFDKSNLIVGVRDAQNRSVIYSSLDHFTQSINPRPRMPERSTVYSSGQD